MSMILCKVGRTRAVICADSRIVIGEGDGISDDCQKLLQAGDRTVCGFVQFSAFGSAPADQISNRISGLLASDERLKDSPRKLLAAIGDVICGQIKRLSLECPEGFRHVYLDSEIVFAAFCLSLSAEGELDLFELRLPIHQSPNASQGSSEATLGEPEIITHADHRPPGPTMYALGKEGPLAARPLNPDLSDSTVLEQVDCVFNKFRDEETGGPIDVAVIDGQGFRWLRTKATHAGIDTLGKRISRLPRALIRSVRRHYLPLFAMLESVKRQWPPGSVRRRALHR